MTEHGHPHDHLHASLPHRHDAGQGPVVLDVGGDVGALVLTFPASMVGAEIEISAVGGVRDGQHVAVHPRTVQGHTIHAAVYPNLKTGDYDLWSPDGTVALTVQIEGGSITEASWSMDRANLTSA